MPVSACFRAGRKTLKGIGVLRVVDLQRLDVAELRAELDDVSSRGVTTMLLDVRNLVDLRTRDATVIAGFKWAPLRAAVK